MSQRMSRVNIAVDFRSASSPASSANFAPALSCAQRAQPLLGGLGGASSLSLLEGDL